MRLEKEEGTVTRKASSPMLGSRGE
ncbi:hypothetical protein Gohar_015187 [Gossypium harknessii]|uniref:Uncharacterized protein n=1 Tax=Gossypium harknessii TaxID=34285 RepID=A0A7J9G146_9ROSI|nr:hypothetical protein [Gossypium harknessii]